jgi:DNA processing protein
MDNTFFTLQLIRSHNLGSRTIAKLLDIYGSPEQAIKKLPELAKRGGAKSNITIASDKSIEDEIRNADNFGAKIITLCDKLYPATLRNIPDSPPVITVRGNTALLQKRCVGIVGSRNSSTAGNKLASIFSQKIGKAGYVIASGLARGIDKAAHEASLETGTIAVIAGGIDNIYPTENTTLYNLLYEKGLVVSEQAFGASPKADFFPKRNRIISGLSQGVLIVEASLRSGSLITARMAGEQGRELFAIPGSPLDARSEGTNHLIREGATLVTKPEDILAELTGFSLKEDNDLPLFSAANIAAEPPLSMLNTARDQILNLLSLAPVAFSDITSELMLPVNVVTIALLELELADKITRDYAGFYTKL